MSDPSTSSTPAQPAAAGVDVTAARARCAAATPGPWTNNDLMIWQGVTAAEIAEADRLVESGDESGYEDLFERATYLTGGEIDLDDDAEFVAHSRTDLPAALDEIERLRGEVNRLAGEVATQRYLYREAGNDRMELRAALDRVLALCDEYHEAWMVPIGMVRAAITGSSS